MSSFDFDPINFGLGLGAGWATAYAAYRARKALRAAGETLSAPASADDDLAARRADSRYLRDLRKYIQSAHITGMELTKVLVEPRFIPAPPLADLPDEDALTPVFHVVPNVPDYPYLQAPYNIETLGVKDLDNGARAIALLGLPGSGRTTALHAIALWSLGDVDFTPPKDAVQKMLDEEEQNLNDEQRAARIQNWLQAQEMMSSAGQEENGLPFRQLTPIYAHLANVTLSEFGQRLDPAEPLLRAVQDYLGYRTARTFPRNLYQRLTEGRALLLLDGFDELPEAEQPAMLDWLHALLHEYGHNFIIVTGAARGYGGLLRAGFSPVFIRPWDDLTITRHAEKWERPLETVPRQYSPLELTLQWWSGADDVAAGFEHLITQMAPNADREMLLQAAAVQLDTGFITPTQLEQASSDQSVKRVMTESEPAISEDEIDALLDRLDEAENTPPAEEFTEDEQPAKTDKAYTRFLSAMVKSGLLVRYRGNRYVFRHPLIAAYLGSRTLTEETVFEKATQPGWQDAIAHAAATLPLDDIVTARTEASADMLQNHLLEMARWLAYAGKVEWRPTLLTALGNIFVAPNQYPLVRERIAAALVGSRDPSVTRIFQRGLSHPNADVRRLSALGVGVLRDDSVVTRLISLMYDAEEDVTLAAGIALGAIGTHESIEAMAEALFSATKETDRLGRVIAEQFATIPAEYLSLYEAARQESIFLRRSAVFGIRRINAPWAVITLYNLALEDDQFYVRAAAETAFAEMEYGDGSTGVPRYPALEDIPWLRDWTLDALEQMDSEEDAPTDPETFLVKALADGAQPLQWLSVTNIGQLGLAAHTPLLYDALRHRSGAVREAAYRALGELQLKMGQPLPSPV